MDESAIKGIELNGDDAASRRRRSVQISVEGYDTWLPEDDVKSALRKHFSSCGEIVHIYIPRDVGSHILNRYALVFILGKGAEEKALKLSGTDVGGWTVIAKPYSCGFTNHEPPVRAIRPSGPTHTFVVTGFDSSLPEGDIRRLLCKHFSSCGEVSNVYVPGFGLPESKAAILYITGEGAVDKAQKLSGCEVGGLNIVVEKVWPRVTSNSKAGYTPQFLSKRKKISAGVESAMKKKTTD